MNPEIQALHQKTASNGGLQKQLLQKNFQGQAPAGKFASPTDNILSPCSQKLTAHKSKFFEKSKPTKLNFSNF